MSVRVRINEDLYNAAKKVASVECRSIPNQIEFWALMGKCALDNPDLPVAFLKELLASKRLDRSLSEPFNYGKKNG